MPDARIEPRHSFAWLRNGKPRRSRQLPSSSSRVGRRVALELARSPYTLVACRRIANGIGTETGFARTMDCLPSCFGF